MEQQTTRREAVKRIYSDCMRKRIGPYTAVQLISEKIGGITGISFKPNKKFTIWNHEEIFPTGYSGGMTKQLYDLIFLTYAMAGGGEVHMSDTMSTKHHKKTGNGFEKELTRIMRKYGTGG